MKNIMLLFLSKISVNSEGLMRNKPVYDIGTGELVETHTTNESALRYVLAHLPEHESLDKVYIFASQGALNGRVMVAEPDAAGEYTSLEYFQHRMAGFWPGWQEAVCVQKYNEDLQGEAAIRQILGMIRDIQGYLSQYQAGEVRLHADLTGGFRSANMAMLNIIKLLQYSGVAIGDLLYSHMVVPNAQGVSKPSYIENANGIYHLLDLVSGAAEFVRFGSIDSILEYYRGIDNKTPALQNLLAAMDSFAKEIKLCHYGTFKDAIRQLQQALHDFGGEHQDTADMLFEALLSRIHREYDSILDHADDDIALLAWCLHRDYLQQAMILYTERILPILLKHGILELTAAGVTYLEEARKQSGRASLKTPLSYDLFVEQNNENEASSRSKAETAIMQGLKKILRKMHTELHAAAYYRQALEQMLAGTDGFEVKDAEKVAGSLAAYNHLAFAMANGENIQPTEAESLWIDYYLAHEHARNSNTARYASCPVNGVKYHKCLKLYYGSEIKNHELKKFLHISVVPKTRLEHMIESGQVHCRLELGKIKAIYEDYRCIRDERNISSHAKTEKSQLSFQEIKSKIQQGLDSIKEVIDRS